MNDDFIAFMTVVLIGLAMLIFLGIMLGLGIGFGIWVIA